MFQNSLEKIFYYLINIEDERERVVDHITIHLAWVKKIFEKKSRPRNLMENDKVFLWDKNRESKGAHGKFESLWKGPFEISKVLGVKYFKLR